MERVDSAHSHVEDFSKNPKPILMTPNQHHGRKSISGIDILNGLKNIATNNDSSISLVSVAPSEHQANHIDDFDLKEAIGYGSSAIVYKAIYKPLNKPMALKIIDLDKFERNQIDELRRETALMALSKHTNVLRVYGSFVHGSKLYIVTPYLSGGSCLDIMKTRFAEGLDELCIATILKQVLEALIYLHKNGHIHRDVKAGNLLMDEDGTVLLGDFGVSSSLMETGERGMRKTFVGTPCWMAPEVMEQAEYDYKADIWSFGITSLELATGHAPFAKFPPLKVLKMTLSNEPPTLDREHTFYKYSKSFKDMIDLCLSKDPIKRPTAEKLIQHPFFKQAKKKEYLVKTILSELPPIEHRPRRTLPEKQPSITNIEDEWDFDDDNMENQDDMSPQAQDNKEKKRHISFGDVIVRSNSLLHPTDPVLPSTTPPKKSRFVIEETTISSSTPISENTTEEESLDNSSEIIRGRFYVNQSNKASENEDESQPSLNKMPSQDFPPTTDRKSRFEISSSQPIPLSRESTLSTQPYTTLSRESTLVFPLSRESTQPIPLSRESSNKSYMRYNSPPDLIPLTSENIALLTESSRKIGRFELTSSTASSIDATPRGSVSSTDQQTTDPHSQIEELLRMNESQKVLLQEICSNYKKPWMHQDTNTIENTIHEDVQSTVEHLEKLIQQTLLENTKLQKENESLRRELKELKLQQ